MTGQGYYEFWMNRRNLKWYWHWVAGNGAITGDGGQGYASRQGVRRAIRRDGKPGPMVYRDGVKR